jgi:hypothetical protein
VNCDASGEVSDPEEAEVRLGDSVCSLVLEHKMTTRLRTCWIRACDG